MVQVERCNVDKKWSLTDVTKGARTIEENESFGEERGSISAILAPLFLNIPGLSKVVIHFS